MNQKAVVFLILLICLVLTGTSQALISFNTGFALSKGKEGNALPDDYWGLGGSKVYYFENSTYRPGFLLGFKVTSSRVHTAFVSFSVNYIWIQNHYKYTEHVSNSGSGGYRENVDGNVCVRSSHINTQINLNLNFLNRENFQLYAALGLSPSIKLATSLHGKAVHERKEYPDTETTYTLTDEQISWRYNALFVSGYIGIGTHLKIFRFPIEFEFAYMPGITNIYELPNFKSSSFFFTLSFQLFSGKKDATPSGS